MDQAFQPTYPVQHDASIQSDTSSFHDRGFPETANLGTHHRISSRSLGRTTLQSQNRNEYPVMASPQWNVPHEYRAREDSAVSPLARDEFDLDRRHEHQDAQSSWYYQPRAEVSLRDEYFGTGPDDIEAENYDETNVSVDKAVSELSTLRVDSGDYRHPTSTTEHAYQDSLRSSSQSSRANSAGSTADTYFSAEDPEQTETFSSTRASNAGSQQREHTPQPTQQIGGTIARTRGSRDTRSRTTAFQRQVDIWQDGHRSPYAPPQLNNRTLLLDTQCQESNWVSANIVDDLDLRRKIRRLSLPLDFSCANGGEMTASEVVTLTFRETGGVARTAHFFVASEEAPFEILLGADDIETFKMLISNPPVARRFFGLIPRKQTKDQQRPEAKRKMSQSSRVKELEWKSRKEKVKQIEKDKRQQEDNRQGQVQEQTSSRRPKGHGR
ncbi:hypothetical protein BKA65DRAFT_513193 [Rhexocercosporidium sp. MPI-PUGE-AT-0058]|nr:hypothetical protein BKA65DRAFT_513193 [Rhexocercosporidium sp. MPI-PUGE-AT-0058]